MLTMERRERATYIRSRDLFKIYKALDLEVVALRGLDLHVSAGEIVAIVGSSGSGKSTLLNILGGYDVPSAGEASVNGRDLLRLRGREMETYRLREVGFVWQQAGRSLLPYLTAVENVELPMLLAGVSTRERRDRAQELLSIVGLATRSRHQPSQLSGGEQQRVAIAVGLANHPPLLLADEPTGELDSETASEILHLFRTLRDEYGTTVVIVTHDPEITRVVDRVVVIRDGRASVEILTAPTFERPGESSSSINTREFLLVDSTGRIQLPREYLDRLRIHERAEVTIEDDRIIVRPEGS